MLHLKLLGPPEVSRGGKPLEFRSRREQGLLFYLAAEDGMHSREKLAELLWPQSQEGRAALRNALSGLRRALQGDEGPEGGAYITTGRGQTVGFDPLPGAELDLRILEAASGPVPLGDTDAKRRTAFDALKAAAEAYRGEFLEGFSLDDAPDFEYWAGVERERWRRHAEAMFDRLSALQFEAGEVEGAIVTAERWTRHAPLSEAAYRRLMEVRFAAGDKDGALHAYEASRQALKESLGIEPEPETEALAARIRAEASPRLPRRRTASARGAVEAPLVGRSEEFATLVREYHAAREEGARAVLVTGEAGIGKTRLISEFLAWAWAEGADVLKGASFEASGRLPYGPVVDALRDRVERERAPDDLLGDVWLSELSRILPEIRDRYPDLPPPTPDETSARTRLFEAASSLVATLAGRAETVVVFFVDDLQWADVATLDFLVYAARRWAEGASPVLLVANLRAEAFDQDPRLAGWWTGMSRDLPAVRLALDALSEEDTVRLLGTLVDAAGENGQAALLERLGRWLHMETGGQPFFLTETLGALVGRGVLVPDPEQGGPALSVAPFDEEALQNLLPTRVRDMIRVRIANLSPAATELLSAAAVLGRGFGFEQVCQVAGLADSDCLPALDEALASGLLRDVGGAPDALFGEDAYLFTHDRVRDVAYTEAGSARRRLFHRRALEVLTEEGAPAAELARHAFAAGMAKEAFRHSLTAGDQALALFATEDAVSHYERAKRLLTGPGRPAPVEPPITELQRLYINLGRAHEFTGRWDDARAAYDAMRMSGGRSGQPALEWSALNRLAILSAQRSFDAPATVGLLKEALQIAEASDDRVGVAETEWNLSQMHAHGLEVDAAITHGEKALQLARELGLRELEARTRATLATAHSFAGRWEACAVNARDGASLYAAIDGRRSEVTGALPAQYILAGAPPSATSSDRAMRVQCLCLLSGGEVHGGSPQAGVEAGREALEISRKLNNQWTLVHSIADLTQGLLDIGEYEEALRNTREGVELGRKLPIPTLFFFTLTALGNAYQALLALEEARGAYEEALAVAEAAASPKWRAFVAPHLCANRTLAGDWEGAHTYARKAVAAREEMPAALIWMDFERHHETKALLRGGAEEVAREDVRRFGEQIGENRRYRIPYLRSLAMLSRPESDETAIECLLEAKALAEEIGLPGELWQIQAEIGELRAECGEVEEARQAFVKAAEIAQSLAQKIADQNMRERFLSALQVRRVLELR